MKKIILRIISLCLIFLLCFGVKASAYENSYSWCTPRNGNLQPKFPDYLVKAADTGAYYIDKNHPDTASEKVLYLTFDAGYENGNVEKIVNVLKEKNVPAAFFVLDHLILQNPNLIIRMKNEGHLVCNHTKNHKNLSFSTKEEIKNDLLALEEICKETTGIEMDKYFRFPEGKFSESALKHVSELGYKTVFWSFAYEDWNNNKQPDPESAMKKILNNTHNGAVMLFHPTSETNAKILGDLIDAWRAEGFCFGTLDELTK